MDKAIAFTYKVTFQKSVNVHVYSDKGVYIDSYGLTYKEFFAMKIRKFDFANECRETVLRRLKRCESMGYAITKNDDLTYCYSAVKAS